MENIPSFEAMPGYLVNLSERLDKLSRDVSLLSQRIKTDKVPKEESEAFIGIDEACALLHLAKPTVYKLAQKGLIPHYKPSKELLFRKSELIEWVENSHRMNKASLEEMTRAITAGNRRKPKKWNL